jgi:hypothetical protein
MIRINELERIWKELSWYLPRGTEENYKKPSIRIAGLWSEI